jgi:hypothetical protein
MKRRDRIVLLVAIGVVALIGVVGGVIAATLSGMGTIDVEVHNCEGTQISVHVPAAFVVGALHLAEEPILEEVPAEAYRYLDLLGAVCSNLAEQPDFRMVEVQDGDEAVVIEKRGRDLVVHVLTDEEFVKVSVPLGAVERIAKSLQGRRIAT